MRPSRTERVVPLPAAVGKTVAAVREHRSGQVEVRFADGSATWLPTP